MDAVPYQREFLHSGLAIPLYPIQRIVPRVTRRHIVGLRSPTFGHAYRLTTGWAAAACLLAVASLALSAPWQRAVVLGSAVLGLYVLLRALVLMIIEQRQRRFEPEWIAVQTGVLRRHAFDLVRFTVADVSGDPGPGRGYDLSRPLDAEDLLARQGRARAAQRLSRATAEFSYLTDQGILAIAEVYRDLSEFTFMPGWARGGRATIRFPDACYVAAGGRFPAERAYWALSGSVLISAGELTYEAGSAEASGLGSAR